jgi:hypothetical protein
LPTLRRRSGSLDHAVIDPSTATVDLDNILEQNHMLTLIATPFYFLFGLLAIAWDTAARLTARMTDSRRS